MKKTANNKKNYKSNVCIWSWLTLLFVVLLSPEYAISRVTSGSTITFTEAINNGTAVNRYLMAYVSEDMHTVSVASAPMVTINSTSTSSATSAAIRETVTDDGDAMVTDRGMVYSSSAHSSKIGESGNTKDDNGTGTGTFSEKITGLSGSMTYYVRAYEGGVTSSFAITKTEQNAGIPGSRVTIDGVGYDAIASNNDVSFLAAGGEQRVSAIVDSIKGTALYTSVPSGLVPGSYRIRIENSTTQAADTTAGIFQVIEPREGGAFTPGTSDMEGVYHASSAAGDYDNDGDLDFIVTGINSSNQAVTNLYRNNGDNTFSEVNANIVDVEYGSTVWGDIDGDGDLDLLITGSTDGTNNGVLTKIYRNDGNDTFTDLNVSIDAVMESSLNLGDVDSDGDLDLLITGFDGNRNAITKLYKNDGNGGFTEFTTSSFTGIYYGSSNMVDYDGDGDLDIFINGTSSVHKATTKLYNNDGSGVFTEVTGDDFFDLSSGSSDWEDFDNDGDLDVAYNGVYTITAPFVGDIVEYQTRLYKNNGDGTFSYIDSGQQGLSSGSLNWVDYNGDGNSDLFITGTTSAGDQTYLYKNKGDGTFDDSGINLPPVSYGSSTWGDFDGDGDLDVLITGDNSGNFTTGIYYNGPISAPSVKTASVDTYDIETATMGGNVTDAGGVTVTEWGVVYSSADQTPTIGESSVIKKANGTGTGTFSKSIPGLSPGTQYHVQAYAINSVDTSYGGVESFTTNTPTRKLIYVNVGTNGANDGTSWTDAYSSLQQALAEATGYDVIVMAGGVYTPGTVRDTSFTITGAQDGLKIYGGYAGSETLSLNDLKLDVRNFHAHATILSGDIDNNDTKTAGVTLDASDISGSNSYHVLYLDGTVDGNITRATVLNGLTVSGGQANGSIPENWGGGLYCNGVNGHTCSPTLVSIYFKGNRADANGGAIYNDGYSGISKTLIISSTFTGNSAQQGGGIYNRSQSGGLSSPVIRNSIFVGNKTDRNGGAIFSSGSGGTSSPLITGSIFAGNSAVEGGALFNDARRGTSSPVIRSSTFINNDASFGGAIRNTVGPVGFNGTSSPEIGASIFYGNQAIINGANIWNSNVTPDISYSLMQGSGGSGSGWNSALGTDGGNNIDDDPKFVDVSSPAGDDGVPGTSDDGLRLYSISPALNAGPADTTGLGLSKTDLTGAARIQEGTINMGAYEGGVTLPLSVTTAPVDLSGLPSVTLGGEVTSKGVASVTERGIVYATYDDTPALGESMATKDARGSGIGSYGISLSGLLRDTTYYVRAYAINAVDTAYGRVKHFQIRSAGALTFDGVDDRVVVSNDGSFNFDEGAISMWIKPTDFNANAGIASMRDDSTRFSLHVNPTTGKAGIFNGAAYLDIDAGISANTWQHVVFNLGKDSTYIYVNGVKKGAVPLVTNTLAKTLDFVIGSSVRSGSKFEMFKGQIDEVRVFNRTLAPQEISAYQACQLPGDDAGLVAYYTANNSSALSGGNNSGQTTLTDQSGHNHAGTLNSFALSGATSNWTAQSPEVQQTACNSIPVAADVTIKGNLESGATLTASYNYSDPENDSETGTAFTWYRADDASGSNATVIAGATSASYQLRDSDLKKYISVKVGPTDGHHEGIPASTPYQGPVFAPSPFAGGDGTEAHPYKVANIDQLQAINDDKFNSKHFIQINDIEASATRNWNNGTGFVPIANFAGTYDGQGYVIDSLIIHNDIDNAAVFGNTTNNSEIKNVGLTNVDINSNAPQYTVGGLVGYSNSDVSECFITGQVRSGDNTPYVGGLIAIVNDGSVENNFSAADVHGGTQVGGFIGEVRGGGIKYNYAIGAVTGSSDVGGFLGNKTDGPSELLTNYWDTQTTGQPGPGTERYTGLTTDEMKKNDSYYLWDFGNSGPWGENEYIRSGYPFLKIFNQAPYATDITISGNFKIGKKLSASYTFNDLENDEEKGTIYQWMRADDATGTNATPIQGATAATYTPTKSDGGKYIGVDIQLSDASSSVGDTLYSSYHAVLPEDAFAGGTGTESDPYQIATLEQLENVRLSLDSHFEMMADIDASPTYDKAYNNGIGFKPLSTLNDQFSGTFDGNGYGIDSLKIYNSEDNTGLFGFISASGIIRNLAITDIDIAHHAQYTIGSVAAGNTGLIENVYIAGRISGDADNSIFNGGVTGILNTGTIKNVFADVQVNGANLTGGNVGFVQGTGNLIENVVNTGHITNSDAGYGGSVGGLDNGATVNTKNVYYDISMLADNSAKDAANAKALSSSELKTQSSYSNFDFVDTWGINPNINNGVPYLRSLKRHFPVRDLKLTTLEQHFGLPGSESVIYGAGLIPPASNFVVSLIPAGGGRAISAGKVDQLQGGKLRFTLPDANTIIPGPYRIRVERTSDGSVDTTADALQILSPDKGGSFTEIMGASFTGVKFSSSDWGDYNGDGKPDLVITGQDDKGNNVTKLYRNAGDSFTEDTEAEANLKGVDFGSSEWVDYDGDGDLDLLITGDSNSSDPVTILYRNTGGSFVKVSGQDFTGVHKGSSAWGDYDGDGNLDLLITGQDNTGTNVTKLYRNSGGSFNEDIEVDANLTGVYESSSAWGDYEGDGDPDLVITGQDNNGNNITKLFKNADGSLTEDTEAGINLKGANYSSSSWGDYDGDGDLDLVITGHTRNGKITKLYTNAGGTFTEDMEAEANLPGVLEGSSSWGDYNGDGKLDLVITGSASFGKITKLYKNSGSSFTEDMSADAELMGAFYGSSEWCDYDGDGDLDLLITGQNKFREPVAKIYKNNSSPVTVTSIKPLGGSTGIAVDSTITITWGKSVSVVSTSGITITSANGALSGVSTSLVDSTLHISHDSFKSNALYTVTIPDSVVKTAGSVYNTDTTFSFTSAKPAPRAYNVQPDSSATAVAVDSVLAVTFDQSVSLDNLRGITISDGNNTVQLGEPTLSDSTLHIPHKDFTDGTTYTVTVDSGTVSNTDGVGNAPFRWKFTSGASNTPPVASNITITGNAAV
ncbi:MAG TPA: FG-GAP-like repeat-containing protein, partial [Balneolaceae bacterium]|nr:FG-GAP-like repeat-containing protein [Balneolaceae bacterium]